MKSKNIPADIKEKSIKEAQKEIEDLITKLESEKIDLEHLKDQYNRVIQLNNHINEQFRKKSEEIKIFKKEKKLKQNRKYSK
jgi:exonuclease VII small subunit